MPEPPPTIKLVDLATPAQLGVDGVGEPSGKLEIEPGLVIANKYLVDSMLGQGGMGLVVAARHLELGHRVAIKVLHYSGHTAAMRFLREAQTCARLTSDHIVRVFDIGRLNGGAPYIVMEFLVGQDLAKVLVNGPVAVPDAARYVVDACAAVAEAHAAGIVHRDLKPANLFLTSRARGTPLVKVLDFGISKVLLDDAPQVGGLRGDAPPRPVLDGMAPDVQTHDVADGPGAAEGGAHLTATGSVVGSPVYMAPEQIRGSRDVDARTDIWSLGVILYELLAGAPPFKAASMPELALAIENANPLPLASLRPNLPPGLEAVALRCLEKQPSARFPSAEALAQALAPFSSSGSSVAGISSRRRWATAGVTIVALALIASGLFTAKRGRSGPGSPKAETTPSTAEAVIPPANTQAEVPLEKTPEPFPSTLSAPPMARSRTAPRKRATAPRVMEAAAPVPPSPPSAPSGPLDTPD